MNHWFALLIFSIAVPLQAADNCRLQPIEKVNPYLGAWIDHDNWLNPENLRIGLKAVTNFMPSQEIKVLIPPQTLQSEPKQLEIGKINVVDPFDQQQSLDFLLDTRLYADGVLVLRDGKILSEHYWHGLSAQQPRLLMGGTQPFLSLMGAMAVAQGKISADKSVIRYIPALNAQTGLRKVSMQRLLEGSGRFNWAASEFDEWRAASGWRSGKSDGDLRTWLNQPDRWEREFTDEPRNSPELAPEGDLLAWALAESYHMPLAQVVCEYLMAKLRPENAVYWLTDAKGTELSGGLALSLRDFARFGQLLIEARKNSSRSKIPSWFIETLTASKSMRTKTQQGLDGLEKGSEYRYGFVHLGGSANRIAVLGPFGNSLYIDFDRRLVVAVFASYPKSYGAGMLATLEQVWASIGSAVELRENRPASRKK